MGNYKFKISDMIPNAWFHKLKAMTKQSNSKPVNKHFSSSSSSSNNCTKKKPSSDSLPHHSYFSNSLVANNPHHNSPRNSLHTKKMSKRKALYKPYLKPLTPPLVSASFNKSKIKGQDSSDGWFLALETSPESFVYCFYEEKDDDEFVDFHNFKINTKKKAFTKHKVKKFDSTEKACPAHNPVKKLQKSYLSVKINKEKEEDDESRAEKKYQKQVSSGRKSSARINLKRVNSPRIQLSSTRRSMARSERKQDVLESFAVMKRSVDPRKDFKESMVEMIEENNIRDSKDLEDLLACYLSLNPTEYHDLIIQVFEQIWLQVNETK